MDAFDCQPYDHNSRDATIRVEVRFFNSLAKYSGHEGIFTPTELPAGATVGEVVRRFKIPLSEIFLVLRNGRDVSPGLYEGGNVNEDATLDDGDVIALSGPVPYSFGYGAPVV